MMKAGLLGIEIGDKTCRYVFLQKGKNGYQVTKAGKSSSEADLSAPGALYSFVQSLTKKEDISPKQIYLTLNFSDLLVHQITVPNMTRTELSEVVSGEIEKVPRFYHRPYDFIFRRYLYLKDKAKVIYAAVAKEKISNVLTDCQKCKISCRNIEIAPLNLKDILPIPSTSVEKEAVLVVNDQNSFLSIIEKGQYRFFYRSSIGMNQIQSIASATAKEHILLNWMGELRRAIKSYLLENKSAKIGLIWLIWDKEILPELDELITQELNLDTESLYLKKIHRINPVQEEYQNPIYALALTPIAFQINKWRAHFPLNHFFRNFNIKSYLWKSVVGATLVVVLAAAAFGLFHQRLQVQVRATKSKTCQLEKKIAVLQDEAKGLYQQKETYLQARSRLLEQASYVNALNRVSWSQVLAVVSQEHPDDLALTSFKFSESGGASIIGQAFAMESIANLMRQIEDSAILEKGRFDFLKERELKEVNYYDFGLTAQLKKKKEEQDDKKSN